MENPFIALKQQSAEPQQSNPILALKQQTTTPKENPFVALKQSTKEPILSSEQVRLLLNTFKAFSPVWVSTHPREAWEVFMGKPVQEVLVKPIEEKLVPAMVKAGVGEKTTAAVAGTASLAAEALEPRSLAAGAGLEGAAALGGKFVLPWLQRVAPGVSRTLGRDVGNLPFVRNIAARLRLNRIKSGADARKFIAEQEAIATKAGVEGAAPVAPAVAPSAPMAPVREVSPPLFYKNAGGQTLTRSSTGDWSLLGKRGAVKAVDEKGAMKLIESGKWTRAEAPAVQAELPVAAPQLPAVIKPSVPATTAGKEGISLSTGQMVPKAAPELAPRQFKFTSGPSRFILKWAHESKGQLSKEDLLRAVTKMEEIGRVKGEMFHPGEVQALKVMAANLPERTTLGGLARPFRGDVRYGTGTDKIRLTPKVAPGTPSNIEAQEVIKRSERVAQWITDNLNKVKPGLGEKVGQFGSVLKGLPGRMEYEYGRQKMFGTISRAEELGQDVIKRFAHLTTDQNEKIFRAIRRQVPWDTLTKEEALAAQQSINQSNMIGKFLKQRGMISEQAYNANKDVYVHYAYLKHELGDNQFNAYLGRQNLSDAEQKAIGLIEDMAAVQSMTVENVFKDIAAHDFHKFIATKYGTVESMANVGGKEYTLSELADNIARQEEIYSIQGNREALVLAQKFREAQKMLMERFKTLPSGMKMIPASRRFGPAGGVVVPEQIYNDVMNIHNAFMSPKYTDGITQAAVKAVQHYTGLFKVTHTALSLPTMMRNVVSNANQLLLSGISPTKLPGYIKSAVQHMHDHSEMWRMAQREGLFKTNFTQAEMGEILNTLRGIDKQGVAGFYTKLANLTEKTTSYYGKIDDFWKMVKFVEGKEKGLSSAEAARLANKWVMDYTQVAPVIGVARRNVAPFITYQSKIAPLIAEALIDRPIQSMTLMSLPALATYAAAKKMNITQVEWNRLQADLPSWVKQNQSMVMVPWRNKEGRIQWVNAEYFTPWGTLLNTIIFGAQDLSRGDISAATKRGNQLASLGMPLYDLSKSIAMGVDSFSGKPLYDTIDSPATKMKKTFDYITKQTFGSYLSGLGGNKNSPLYQIYAAAKGGEKTTLGEDISPAKALLAQLGIKAYSPPRASARNEREYYLRLADTEKRRALGRHPSEKERINIIRSWKERRRQLIHRGAQSPVESLIGKMLPQ